MEKIIEKKYCTGCHACYNVCPQKCITMYEDEEGFLYPKIDSCRCLECGKCKNVCPVIHEYSPNPIGKAYACINKDEHIREMSSSGGVFTLLAKAVINHGGVVFGAAFDQEFLVRHIGVDNEEELGKLRGSKYLQSRISNIYEKVKETLAEEKIVLFSGTPCQISGLKAYLGKSYENLILQDIICHGVPSPKVWKQYVDYREKKASSKLSQGRFRDKSESWKAYSIMFEFQNGKIYKKIFSKDSYMQCFLSNLCLRPSCYNCHSKSKERESDITLADFWGIEKDCPEMFDNKGTSLILINSFKGMQLFNEVSSQMRSEEVNINDALSHNPSAFESVKYPEKRKQFMSKIFISDFEKNVKKYTGRTFLNRCKNKLKVILKIRKGK